MLDPLPTGLAGCFLIRQAPFEDARGSFSKTFHEPTFKAAGLHTDFPEEFVTLSHAKVLRGLHFQLPPHDHVKIVACFAGEILDAVVDLRRSSPTFGKHFVTRLSPAVGAQLYIPPGLAHGFYVTQGEAIVHYRTSTVHAPSHDAGISWRGCGVEWPDADPVISARDAAWPALADFASPF